VRSRPTPNFRRPAMVLSAFALVGLLAGCNGVQNGAGGGGGDSADFPSGPIEFQVGASAGGSTDLLARALAKDLEEPLGETVNVLNAPGANGAVAAGDVLNSPADGETMMLVSGSLITITPLFVTEDEAINLEDIQIVTGVGREDYVLVTSKESGITSIDDLVSAGRTINYGTAGVGTGGQLSQNLLFDELGIDATDVPFEGGAPAVTALLGNQVDVASVQVLEAAPHIKSGDFVPLAIFGEERNDFFPDVPTAVESGYDVVVTQSRFVLVPKDTPDDVVETLADAFSDAFESQDYQDFLEQNFITPDETDAEETAANLQADKDAYEEAAQAAGLLD
jgi:tripartite-type tricarboxylate transporter receptor subunit TctC